MHKSVFIAYQFFLYYLFVSFVYLFNCHNVINLLDFEFYNKAYNLEKRTHSDAS